MTDEYREPYLRLWSGITDALAAIRDRNYGLAEKTLVEAQQAAEEAWISAPDTILRLKLDKDLRG